MGKFDVEPRRLRKLAKQTLKHSALAEGQRALTAVPELWKHGPSIEALSWEQSAMTLVMSKAYQQELHNHKQIREKLVLPNRRLLSVVPGYGKPEVLGGTPGLQKPPGFVFFGSALILKGKSQTFLDVVS